MIRPIDVNYKLPQPHVLLETFTSKKKDGGSLVYTCICNINTIYHYNHGNKVHIYTMGIIRCQLYKIKSGLNKAILAKGSSCGVTSGVMHKGGGGQA